MGLSSSILDWRNRVRSWKWYTGGGGSWKELASCIIEGRGSVLEEVNLLVMYGFLE